MKTENEGEKEKREGCQGGGGGLRRQKRLQQWRQWPGNNMPNPRSHFLLHRRLLWNSSSVANVTTTRGTEGREKALGPPHSNPPSVSLPFSLLHPVPLSSAVFVRLSRANTNKCNIILTHSLCLLMCFWLQDLRLLPFSQLANFITVIHRLNSQTRTKKLPP